MEIGFESGKSNSITFPVETRIYNKCNNNGEFGRQIIQVSQKSFNKWSETEIDVGFSNKYIFSNGFAEGKKFYVFSKPFEFPFKIADLIYITSASEKYCFVNPPEEIEKELLFLDQENLIVKNCSEDDVKVCFSGTCDIRINLNTKQVIKEESSVSFNDDALMYAAIFSDENVYECHVKRLMKRLENLAILYNEKAIFLSLKGCNSNLDLLTLINLAQDFDNSQELNLISEIAEEIQEQNNLGECKLW